jgi:hypothetical protein
MPIQFPVRHGPAVSIIESQWLKMMTKCFDAVPAPNMGRVGIPFIQQKQGQQPNYSFDPGVGVSPIKAVNLRRLGTMYQEVTQTSRTNPANLINVLYDECVGYDRNFAEQNNYLTGVSRDASGTPVAGVTVKLFRTSDDSLVGQTISDASGSWRFDTIEGGPYYLVEYKAGPPDVFGTSPNTLVETIVNGGI